jgi:hypothetical protein
MAKAEQGMRGIRYGGRAAAIGAAVAVTVLGLAGSALASPGAIPAASRAAAAGHGRDGRPDGSLAGRSGAPRGWVPATYRRAQLSVPGSWLVEIPRQVWCAPGSGGMIFVGGRPEIQKGAGCSLPASVAWIQPAGHVPPGIRRRKPTAVIHGIPVYRLPSGRGSVLYLAPKLGVRVGARGPRARRVLDTLTWSPLSVVLRRGRAAPVPANWAWRRFGGVRFATPRSWRLLRENQWASCGTGLLPGSLLLIDAVRPAAVLPCPAPVPSAVAEQGSPGLTVVTGKYAARSVSEHFASCRVRRGTRVCLASVTGQGGPSSGVLIFSASRPHRHAATYFVLGLSGSGATARAIFDSVSVARL